MELLKTVSLITTEFMVQKEMTVRLRVTATSSQTSVPEIFGEGHVAQWDPRSTEHCKVLYERALVAFLAQ